MTGTVVLATTPRDIPPARAGSDFRNDWHAWEIGAMVIDRFEPQA